MTPPDPLASWEAAFAAWLAGEAAAAAAAKPWMTPYDAATFAGCPGVPDDCLPCCGAHDVAYHFCETPAERLAADRALRDCVAAYGRRHDSAAWRLLWLARAWSIYA